jgi:hypothetical protein
MARMYTVRIKDGCVVVHLYGGGIGPITTMRILEL